MNEGGHKPFETEPREAIEVANAEELQQLLTAANIPYQEWPKQSGKGIADLFTELEEGESQLVRRPDGSPLRIVYMASAVVQYTEPSGQVLQLHEDRQVFASGFVRRRGYADVREKLKADEDPEEGILRGIQEELNLKPPFDLQKLGAEVRDEDSISYPGLPCEAHNNGFLLTLNPDQFNPEGYIEHQPGKKDNFFVWKPVENPKR